MKKRVLIPNAVTTANMLCGYVSMICADSGQLAAAAWWIILAAVFDLIDGRIARLLDASSEFGEYYDTLSDLLSFGVAPAVLFYHCGLKAQGGPWLALPFLYLIAVAFRLARFSIKASAAPKGYFQGLSSPVSAATASSFVLFAVAHGWIFADRVLSICAVALGLAFLMVSTVRFPTFKEVKWKSTTGFALLGTGVISLVAVLMSPAHYLFPAFATFIAAILGWNIISGSARPAPWGHSKAPNAPDPIR